MYMYRRNTQENTLSSNAALSTIIANIESATDRSALYSYKLHYSQV